ncbi:MAG: NAD(P)/FAD-dependent oxidoreductase, partial [Acidobacteriota bacterium]
AGQTLEDSWGDGRYRALRGILLPHFPNFFLMLGPGTPIGNNSVIGMSEVQMDYVLQLIDLWRRGELDAVEPTQEATDRFGRYLKAGLGPTVWNGGCQSWYQDADGQPVIFPYSWAEFVDSMAAVDIRELRPR